MVSTKFYQQTHRLAFLFAIVCGSLFLVYGSLADEVAKSSSSKASSVINIGEDDWDQMLTGEWMVEFHAPWCPACRALQSEWKSFSGWSSELGIKVGAVDVTVNPGLSGRFLVTALPTIYHVKDGVFRQYKGTRDANTFVSFVEEKKWKNVEPLTSWKSPNSIQMSLVSSLFRISMYLRSLHNSLVEDYGVPYWGSYIIFAFATILIGAVLGLLIVCIIDILWPTKYTIDELKEQNQQKQKNEKKQSEKKDDDDDDDEDDGGDEEADDDYDEEGDEQQQLTDSEVLEDDEVLGEEQAEEEDDAAQQAQESNKGLRKRRARKD